MSRPPSEPPPQRPFQPPSQPRISDDGKFYWDGQRWAPLPSSPASEKRVVVTKQPRGAWNSLVGYGCMGIAALFVFVALAAWCGHATTT